MSNIQFTPYEIQWLQTMPEALRCAAEYHSEQATMGDAMGDFDPSYHDKRYAELMAKAEQIEVNWGIRF